MGSLDKIGTVLATKVLCDNITVAEDVVITLPDIKFVTSEIKAMGTLNVPTPLTNPIEPTITSVGMDNGLYNMLGLSSKTFEFRFVKNVLNTSGDIEVKGYKVFIKGIPFNVPGGSVEPGASWSGDVKISATRYQVFVDGVEKVLIDKLKNTCKINGVDYAKDMKSLI